MRKFFGFALATLFVLGLPVWLIMAMPRFSGFTVNKLSHELHKEGAYVAMSTAIQDYLDQTAEHQDQSEEQHALGLVRSLVTPEYVQQKTDALLGQVADWAVDPAKPSPKISFNDIQQKLVEQNPELKQQLDQALIEIQKGQAQTNGTLPQVVEDQQSQEALQDILTADDNFVSVAQGDWTFSLEKPLAGLPPAYRIYTIAFPILGVILLLCLIGVVLLARTWPSRMVWLGWTLLVAAIWNGLLFAIFWAVLLQNSLLRALPISGPAGDMARGLIRGIRNSLFGQAVSVELILTLALVVVGVGLLIGARIYKQRSGPAIPTADPLTKSTDTAEKEDSATPQPDQPKATPVESAKK